MCYDVNAGRAPLPHCSFSHRDPQPMLHGHGEGHIPPHWRCAHPSAALLLVVRTMPSSGAVWVESNVFSLMLTTGIWLWSFVLDQANINLCLFAWVTSPGTELHFPFCPAGIEGPAQTASHTRRTFFPLCVKYPSWIRSVQRNMSRALDQQSWKDFVPWNVSMFANNVMFGDCSKCWNTELAHQIEAPFKFLSELQLVQP